jgi:hypothetical protein
MERMRIGLCDKVIKIDDLAQRTETLSNPHYVVAELSSITQSEWSITSQQGLQASYQAIILIAEYSGQKIVKIGNTVYKIYRTYKRNTRQIELYLDELVGETNAS